MASYRPFLTQSTHLSMGIRTLPPADWLEVDDDADHQMTARRKLLDQKPLEVVGALPGSEAGQNELLDLLLAYLARHQGDRYDVSSKSVLDRGSGQRFELMPEPHAPFMMIGRLVQEDFCLLQQHGSTYRLVGAVLCFPAHWRLRDKMGRSLLDIHEPVPGFADQLGTPITKLFERLDDRRPVQRLNWSLVDTDELYLPPEHRRSKADLTAANIGARLWLRVERQTLRRLPVSQDIVFGIRTYLIRLEEAVDEEASATMLMAKLETMPSSMLRYKNLEAIRPVLEAYFQERFASA